MVEALRRVAGDAVADRVTWEREERIEKIVGTWPAAWDVSRANWVSRATRALTT
jgi:hypothetical protein